MVCQVDFHEKANKILDLPTREEQVKVWKLLPDEERDTVAQLIRIHNKAKENYCIPAWRSAWVDKL